MRMVGVCGVALKLLQTFYFPLEDGKVRQVPSFLKFL